MRFVQPQVSDNPAELARSLVAWLNRSRTPALFREMAEPFGISRNRLRQLTESWISAGYWRDSWSMKDDFEASVRFITVSLHQTRDKPVRTTIMWGQHSADDTPTGIGDAEYAPPTGSEEEIEAQELIEGEIA